MFALDERELDNEKRTLQRKGFEILVLRQLDTPALSSSMTDALREGLELFNAERFWESHEVLEQAWHASKGARRESVQSLILVAAAFVHYQKGEDDICLSVLKRARAKMGAPASLPLIDIEGLRQNVDRILSSGQIHPFRLPVENGSTLS